ncbi:MAG: PQQ-binding-like beta-propeller repeat protein [Planctomycetaceae bacterium]
MRSLNTAVMVWLVASAGAVADWRQFRGDTTSAVAADASLSGNAREPAIQWSQALPGRGLSSPIVVGPQVIVTASSGYRQNRLHVLSFDAADGKLQWERQFWATGRTVSHPKSCVAAPTPASDGQRIFAFYSSNDLACLDLDGNLLWYRGLTFDYPNASNSLGMSSSLVTADDTVVAMVENDSDSFTVGLDVATGEDRWRIQRPRAANWTSPALWEADGKQLVLLQSSKGVTAIDPRTGKTVWEYGDGASTIPSLVANHGLAFVPSHGITAIRPGATTPDVAEIVWQEGSLSPGTASPLVHDGSVFVLSNPNVLTRAAAADGQTQWKTRLTGNFSGSPVIAGGFLYAFNEDGVGHVVDIGAKGETVGTIELGETVLSTPAVGDGGLFIRSDGHVWKIAGK